MKDAKTADRMKKLQDEMNDLKTRAHDEVLTRIRADIATLEGMGFQYQLVARTQRATKRMSDPSRPCPVCKFVTEPHHDARSHRAQGKSKKAFTNSELSTMGLRKIS